MNLGHWLSYFAHPAVLAALVVVPALTVMALVARSRRRRDFARIGPPYALVPLVEHPRRRMAGLAAGLALTLTAIGAAGPRWGQGAPPPIAPGRDLVVVLDVSRSMLARDALPSRLGKAKEALAELADAVQSRGGHRLALVAVAGQARLVCPLTHDYDAFRAKAAALDADPPPAGTRAVGAASSGTRLGEGLRVAVAALDPRDKGAQDILLLTDGDDPAGDDEWRLGLSEARTAGVPVHTVGLGDPDRDSPVPTSRGERLEFQGSEVRTRLHEEPLQEIARRSGGTYLPARTGTPPLSDLFRTSIAPGATRDDVAGTLPQPPGRESLFFAAALTLLTLRGSRIGVAERFKKLKGWLRSRFARPAVVAAAVCLLTGAAAVDLALRRGNSALTAGRAEEALDRYAVAAERTTDPGVVAFNQGVALARLGRYREAELHFRRSLSDAVGDRRARALYNLGCCLLQESRGRLTRPLRQSVRCFEQALDGAAEDLRVDVLHNLELSKRLLAHARATAPNQPEPPDGELDAPPPPRPLGPDPSSPAAPGREPGMATGPADRGPQAAKAGNAAAKATDTMPPPGKGNLPPLPDDDVLVPLTPEDASALLDRATARIVADRSARIRQTAPAPSQQFPDW